MAPWSVNTEPTEIVCVDDPLRVRTGICVSTTVTKRVTCTAGFPCPSIALYVTMYEPTTDVLTVEALIIGVNPKLILSVTVAPSSTYADPTEMV